MKIGVVGPEESKWRPNQAVEVKKKVAEILRASILARGIDETVLVSGHCPKGGVDIWAEEVADELGIKKEIYPAEVNQWEDLCELVNDGKYKDTTPLGSCDRKCTRYKKGYRSRNIQIAEACDVLYCIVPHIPFKDQRFIQDVIDNRKGFCKHCNERGHPSNGGCWTMKYTGTRGKKTTLILVN